MKLSKIDVMLDIETLGTGQNATITQIAAAAWNLETGELIEFNDSTHNTFNITVNLDLMKTEDINIDISTIKFWTKNSHNTKLFKEILNNKSSFTEKDAVFQLILWLKKLQEHCDDLLLWGNGSLFDNTKIINKCEYYDISYPISFWNERDVRTIVDIYCRKNNITDKEYKNSFPNENLHQAIDDVLNQIKYTSFAYKNM